MEEAGKLKYSVEREVNAADCTPDFIKSLIIQMEIESGLSLTPSEILRQELGL
jgi:hypothetical protein